MPRSKIALYLFIAFVAMVVAYFNLVEEPHPDWPINLIHLITRH